MATILETKQALSDIRNELRKEQQRGVELGVPQLPVRNATLHMDDDARQVLQRTPTNAEIVTSWRVDPITTQLYRRIHGY